MHEFIIQHRISINYLLLLQIISKGYTNIVVVDVMELLIRIIADYLIV